MKPDEKKSIDDTKLQTQILDYLKKHKSTQLWMEVCDSGQIMDVPIMVAEAIVNFINEIDFETQNVLQDKFDEGYTKRMEDEKKIDNLTSL